MACCTCEELKTAIKAELNSVRKKELQIAYRDHIDKVDAHRIYYLRAAAKSIMKSEEMLRMTNVNMSDVCLVADASGGMGTVFHPHMHCFHKNEVQRHELLKVHCMFAKIQGYGINIYRGVSKLEATNGANFTLESIFDTLVLYLIEKREKYPGHQIRNLHVQMDNAKGNKCWVVFAGLSILVAYGIVEKVKLSYGVPNHGHTDVDGSIGCVITGKYIVLHLQWFTC